MCFCGMERILGRCGRFLEWFGRCRRPEFGGYGSAKLSVGVNFFLSLGRGCVNGVWKMGVEFTSLEVNFVGVWELCI